MSCIYKITNKVNNKIYIGLTTKSLENRWKEHQANSKRQSLEKRALYSAIKKYGNNNFKVEEIVSGSFNKLLLPELERHYIQLYNSYAGTSRLGYNLTTGGDGVENKIVNKETCMKISKSLTGKTHSKETKQKQSIAHTKLVGKRNPWFNKRGAILQFDKDNNLVARHETTVRDLSKKLNIKESTLSMHFSGKSKTCKGQIFKYENQCR